MVEPGLLDDWEAQVMAQDENLEITGGLGAERVREQLVEQETDASQTVENGEGADSAAAAETAQTAENGDAGSESTENGAGVDSSGETAPAATEPAESQPSESQTASSQEPVSIQTLAGTFYTLEQLQDVNYLLSHAFCLDPTCMVDETILDGEAFVNKDLKLVGTEEPQVLIYHTHSQEAYADSVPGDASMTVQGVGDELARILTEKYGLSVLHNTTPFDMMEGQLERSSAYSYAKVELEQILEEYPSIQIIIDLHRDGVPDDLHLATEVNGKPTAQIMFFNGVSQDLDGPIDRLPNPYREDNLAFSFQMYIAAQASYPDFCRDIYLKGYRYNLHFRPRSVLLEVGAQTNTYEEAVNAMEPFADILAQVVLPAQEAENG